MKKLFIAAASDFGITNIPRAEVQHIISPDPKQHCFIV
jgi:hypothetical protein